MRKVRVNVDVEFEVVDAAALEQAALDAVDAADFTGDAERSEERERIRTGPAAAAVWLLDPFLMTEALPGVESRESSHFAIELDESGMSAGLTPDFATLFPVCRCGDESCDECAAFQLTPRTALALWSTVTVASDSAYDDVEQHGDEPVQSTGDWDLFDQYPRITHSQNAVWRRQAARAFDDLAYDLSSGDWPRPTCIGEEMALQHALRFLEDGGLELMVSADELSALPDHPDDLIWEACREGLCQDSDVLLLFDDEHDGVEDPASEENRKIGMGDYRPGAWFGTFGGMSSRDGRRPFRR